MDNVGLAKKRVKDIFQALNPFVDAIWHEYMSGYKSETRLHSSKLTAEVSNSGEWSVTIHSRDYDTLILARGEFSSPDEYAANSMAETKKPE